MTRVAVLGLGEAGRTFAAGLVGHVAVRGWDPAPTASVDGVARVDTAEGAVRGADAVLAFAPAARAASALASAVGVVSPGTLYADFATADPALKRALAGTATAAGMRFADAAIMAPVRRGAANTPILVSGDGATALAELLAPAGIPSEIVPGEAGTAAARKLLRSMLVKGLTGVMIESLRAAEREGLVDWFAPHLLATLTDLDEQTLAGFVGGTAVHAVRRIDEMEAAATMAETAGGRADITRAVAELLRSVAGEGVPEALG
ncbi:DUF1932 domain-containing protein [Protaetiibacter mangrovi]|uniref:DUF1932 domain-containing protein n=1 Tax=Protaetiibacter mangrovi TaxID=2970926 RepID=A0ABT1ZGJ4_9MICO|nr:DUF1932 domain-containing protein [Protaetiibacter mangrovi]MCS0499829.1 DUF1932 domain-containing protein [Protaetiibacter mangrovi]TPX02786.1 NAD(P)-dependent oxidoreductase [Schumannella luteola]